MKPSEVLQAAAERLRDLAAHYVDAAGVPDRHKWWVYWSVDRSASEDARRWIAALSPAVAPHLEAWLRETAKDLSRMANGAKLAGQPFGLEHLPRGGHPGIYAAVDFARAVLGAGEEQPDG